MTDNTEMSGWPTVWRSFWARTPADRWRLARRAWRSLGASGARATARRARWSVDYAAARTIENQRYLEWCRRHTPDADALARMSVACQSFAYRPLVAIVTPVYNTDPRWLDACAASVMAQAYDRWEWHIGNDGSNRPGTLKALARMAALDARIVIHTLESNQGISAASNRALAACSGDYVGLMDHDDALLPHALFRVVEHLNRPGDRADVIYTDEDKLELDGTRSDAYFKPDWSPELLLANMYSCHFLVLRRELVNEIGGFRSAFDFSQDHDLMLRAMERANRIDHVADVLYHWRKIPESGASVGTAKPTAHDAGRRAIQDYMDRNRIPGHAVDAGPPGFHRPVFVVRPAPRVSIIGNLDEAAREALVAGASDANAEIVASPADATGTLLLFMEAGVAPEDPSWLDALVQMAARPGVGAVGGKVLRADGTIEHIGLVLGLCGIAGRPFLGAAAEHPGYFGSALAARPVSAVSGTCLMTPRDVFERAGMGDYRGREGMAIDYCLRVAELGLRTVFTPFAVLRRTGNLPVPAVLPEDEAALRERWGTRLDEDRYYNPNLSREALDYRVAL